MPVTRTRVKYGQNLFERPIKEKDKEPPHPRQPGYVEQPVPGSFADKLKKITPGLIKKETK